MLFNSFTFLVFFVVVLAMYFRISTWTGRKRLLLVASYVFYAAWSVPYVLLLAFATIADWSLARWLDRTDNTARRRLLLVASLACNLGVLGYFKYAGFLVENFNLLMALAGVSYQPAPPNIVLPLAISFYTFASLSYTIDVYRREIKADAKFGDYALFVTFFPHLIAGPIVRADYLLPQFASPKLPSNEDLAWGLVLVVLGLAAKVVLADGLLADFVNQVYAAPSKFAALEIWAAVFGFSTQIYLDFCGYSLCAIGLALCFGFSFPENFRYPYAASGFSDFWRRWHISLSTWLRDYLYIPLGGNRGRWLTYRNLMLTMLIGGLWHGASWMFVVWGGLHGLYLAIERFIREFRTDVKVDAVPGLGKILFTFLIVTLTWIPFRATTPANAMAIVEGLFRLGPGFTMSPEAIQALLITALIVAGNIRMRARPLREIFESLNQRNRTLVILACLIGMFLTSAGNSRTFIYFQF